MTKYISAVLASLMLIPPGAAVIDMFAEHEEQRDALRCCEEIIEAVEETPEEEEVAPAVPSVGIGREAYEPAFEATADELEQLVILCYLEAGGESDACVRAVAEVVFNRLASGIWGETLTDVIYAPGEFEPAHMISSFDEQSDPIVIERLEEIRSIIYDIYFNGCRIDADVMFFRTDYYHAWAGAIDEFNIGNVYFSSSRWCER